MKFLRVLIPIGLSACFFAGWMFGAPQQTQTAPKSGQKGQVKAPQQKPPAKRPPLTRADVQKLMGAKGPGSFPERDPAARPGV